MDFIDVFSGAGLLSAGFVRAGFTPRLAIDMDADAIASYRQNVAPVAEVSDVSNVRGLDSVKVLIAGPPCQGFSTLGRRDPLDKRNSLSLLIPKWARVLNVSTVVIENVPQFTKSTYWKQVTSELEADGFKIVLWIMNSEDYGVPQRRRRAFTIAVKGEVPVLPSVISKNNAAQAFEKPIDDMDAMHIWPVPSGIAKERIERIPPGGDKRNLMSSFPELCPDSWHKMGAQATDVWGRINPNVPANTLRCCFQNPSKGRYLHPKHNRVISLREGARLQGIPDDWNFIGSRTSIARQIGNGVPIPLAEAIATSIAKVA